MGWSVSYDSENVKATLSKDGVTILDLYPSGVGVQTVVTAGGDAVRYVGQIDPYTADLDGFLSTIVQIATALNDTIITPGSFDVRAYNADGNRVACLVVNGLGQAIREANAILNKTGTGIVKVYIYDANRIRVQQLASNPNNLNGFIPTPDP